MEISKNFRAKLTDQVHILEFKAVKDLAQIVELFEQIQTIAAKIKATGNLNILENDKEYIVLVSNNLSKEFMWRKW